MNNFADRLQRRIDELQNPSCLGLDPLLSYLPKSWQKEFDFSDDDDIYLALRRYCFDLLDATADIIPAIKPQMAYFEQYGTAGISAVRDIIAEAKALGMLVIVDGKRNDIGSTASAYSNAYLTKTSFSADALTVNAYLGSDGIRPFLEKCDENGKGVFILCRTSNPSAGELIPSLPR